MDRVPGAWCAAYSGILTIYWGADIYWIPVFLLKKQLREAKELALGHTARERWSTSKAHGGGGLTLALPNNFPPSAWRKIACPGLTVPGIEPGTY